MRALSKTLAFAALAAIGSSAVEHATAVPSAATTARPGQPAPSFSAPDIAGKTVRLGDYAGKIVVLEWTNDGCPFVGKHYNSGNMQALQQKYTGTGVVWLTIASSAPGEGSVNGLFTRLSNRILRMPEPKGRVQNRSS